MSDALRELKWIHKLSKELGLEHTVPTCFISDDKTAIYINASPVFHERTKHIENDCHSVRDAVRDGLIVTQHIRTGSQIADILTKALGRITFQNLSSKLGILNFYASA